MCAHQRELRCFSVEATFAIEQAGVSTHQHTPWVTLPPTHLPAARRFRAFQVNPTDRRSRLCQSHPQETKRYQRTMRMELLFGMLNSESCRSYRRGTKRRRTSCKAIFSGFEGKMRKRTIRHSYSCHRISERILFCCYLNCLRRRPVISLPSTSVFSSWSSSSASAPSWAASTCFCCFSISSSARCLRTVSLSRFSL